MHTEYVINGKWGTEDWRWGHVLSVYGLQFGVLPRPETCPFCDRKSLRVEMKNREGVDRDFVTFSALWSSGSWIISFAANRFCAGFSPPFLDGIDAEIMIFCEHFVDQWNVVRIYKTRLLNPQWVWIPNGDLSLASHFEIEWLNFNAAHFELICYQFCFVAQEKTGPLTFFSLSLSLIPSLTMQCVVPSGLLCFPLLIDTDWLTDWLYHSLSNI